MTPTSTPPTAGAVRLVRAGTLGACALALAVVAHVAGGGAVPGAGALALLGLLTAAPVLVVTSARLGRAALLAALGGLEAALHAGLTLLAGDGAATVVGAGHHHATLLVTGHDSHLGGHGLAMTLAHALATVLTALVLARGEALLWLALTSVAPAVAVAAARALAALRSLTTPPMPRPSRQPFPRRAAWARRAPRRGPPAPGAALPSF